MINQVKNIHIGQIIENIVVERNIKLIHICRFFDCSESDVQTTYNSPGINSDMLLKWSKLLDYDLFRIYSQHLILYSPPSAKHLNPSTKNSNLIQFRKNLYTKEMIDFILEQIKTGEMSKIDVINNYGIPKSTLYKWVTKYQN